MVVDYKPKYYTLRALPKSVEFTDIKWIEKPLGDSGD